MLTWDKPDERFFEHGLDRGALYMGGAAPIPWNGLTSFDEGGSGNTSLYYRDGLIYLADAEASDFSGKLSALFFPDEFSQCLGIPEVADGLFVDNQKPQRFGLSYRTLVGSGETGDLFGYQIHLVYNCMATVEPRSRRTLGSDSAPTEFTFNIVCTPVKLTGFRPTAHYVIDTRHLDAATVADLENLIYGSGSLPAPQVLFDMLNFGNAITVTVHTNGTYTVEGSNKNVYSTDYNIFQMDNINGVDNGDGTYVISDGGTTDVILE